VDPRSQPADGFTIIEVVVAITVLVVAMLAAAALFSNAIIVSGNTRNRVVAANLATQQMENVRGLAADPTKFTTIPQGQTIFNGASQKVNGVQYTVTQDVTFVTTNSSTSSCDSPGPTAGQILQVSDKVTWPGMGGTQPVKAVTALAPPVGVYSASSGSIAAKVFDSAGAVAPGINVQVAGPSTVTQQTTSEGCAYFAYLPVGTYTVSVIAGTGVDAQEVVVPVQTSSVSVGQTASVQFQYDSPATITATLPSPGNTAGAPPYATGMSISVANTGLQPYGQFSFPASAVGDVTTSPSLFPYASGYTVFAGNCTDNNPLGKDNSLNPLYPTAAPVPLAVPPNGSAVTTVQLYTVAIHVQNTTAVPVSGTTPTAAETTSFGAPYASVCTSGTASGTAPTLGLVTLDATGDSVTALPLGHWTLKAKCTKPAAPCPAANTQATLDVWVKPDGVYAVDGTGESTTAFVGPITMVVS
jgi:prepilin-type N-terminal cleavage/methylation domain-containing protein